MIVAKMMKNDFFKKLLFFFLKMNYQLENKQLKQENELLRKLLKDMLTSIETTQRLYELNKQPRVVVNEKHPKMLNKKQLDKELDEIHDIINEQNDIVDIISCDVMNMTLNELIKRKNKN